jgi:NAD-dependent DNA ligase/DNA polymerase/3'-5' exonuclease PolX
MPKKTRKLIIESSSSPPNSSLQRKIRQTKKRRLIIESSSSSPKIKDKIDTAIIPPIQTHLKITPEVENMNNNSRLNEPFIEIMEKLSDIMLKHGEPFRARAYQKAQETILTYPGDILSPDDLKGRPGIGPTIMEKLEEYVKTGTLRVLEKEKLNPVNILADVYGIGPKKANELVEKGITSIAQLRENQQLLNDVQKVGLHYYEDILKRIPRAEIQDFEKILQHNFQQVATISSKYEIVGSYRRGAESSGDIDVIITSDNPSIFFALIDKLIQQKIILEVLSRGPSKCLVIAKIPSSDSARRVDFLYTGFEEFPFAILYFTGSKMFNTVMRHHALTKGLTMNEHGLYKMEDKKKGEKVVHKFLQEKDIFDYLGMEYKTPIERVDGRAVIIKQMKKPNLIIEEDSNEVLAEEFRKSGIHFLASLNESQLSGLLHSANVAYYNQEPFLTDNEFDIIKEFMEAKYPSNQVIAEIGAPVERNKVQLPYHMGSMDKIKPDTNALSTWVAKYRGPYVLSCKLDGVSGLYTTEGPAPKLYTRGDGKVGQDVSHLIPYLRLPKTKGLVIRGEFIIPKLVFEEKYSAKFANPRNMVSGIINQKSVNEVIKDVYFVAYELIQPVKKPSEQMAILGSLDINRVLYKVEQGGTLTNDLLSQTLVEWRQNYVFEIDGVIVTNDAIYERKPGNPDYAFAFKMVLSDQVAEAKVVDVIWTPSKDGYLKPRVQIEPINLGGVRIEYATGFNGAFIHDNKVGVGATIELIRSGDVIPHIRKVVMPAMVPQMPQVAFKWNSTHVDIMLEDVETDETVKEKNITGFFRGIGVEGLSSGNVARIIQTGFDTVTKILNMTIPDFLKVEGFKDKTATKLYNGIREKIEAASLVTIMSASNIFGRGFSEKRLELIMESYPNVIVSNESKTQKIANVAAIKGMAGKTAEAFVERIPNFIAFMQEAGLENKLSSVAAPVEKQFDTSHPLFGKTIVMTGFRDASIQEAIKKVGAKLGTSVSKSTFVVLVKDKEEDTGKAAEARKLGVPLMTPAEFISKFNF